MGSSSRCFACTPRTPSGRQRVRARIERRGENASRGGYRTVLSAPRTGERSGTLARPMRPTPLRLLVVIATSAAFVGVAVSGVFAGGDLAACSLVASERSHPNPLGTILEAVDAVDGQAWAVGGPRVGPGGRPVLPTRGREK